MAAVVCLSACSWNRIYRGDYPQWPWGEASPSPGENAKRRNAFESLCKADVCNEVDALNAWHNASMYCLAYHQDFTKSGDHKVAAKTGARTFGIIAGTLLQNVTTGSVSKAWGSVAGATNAIGDQLDGVLLGAISLNQRAAIEKATIKWDGEYQDISGITPTDSIKKVWIAVSMARECSMSAARAEQEVLSGLNGVLRTNVPAPTPALTKQNKKP
jgi:hypothetical protein